MTSELHQLVEQTIELTGAEPPAILNPDAPILAASQVDSIYLIGLVGGKDVGKSSLVNALVGQQITAPTSFGPGTERVIAYAHQSAVVQVKQMLFSPSPPYSGERAGVRGGATESTLHLPLTPTLSPEYRGEGVEIVAHQIESLKNQVLLDLPDIDSHYADHVRLTRRMLRHMLYPLWIQSVEKYADLLPQQLLACVAEGNDPANFIFCLNKADQLDARQADELRQDYAQRLARVLKLDASPTVYLLSATRPDQFDLPALRQLLSRSRSTQTVRQSRTLADHRQQRSLLGWIEHQQLAQRAERLDRLTRDAQEITADRIALPLLNQAIPSLLDDPANASAMIEPVMCERLSRWPIVNAIDALLGPVLAVVRMNLKPTAASPIDSTPVSTSIQTAFAQLQQLHPDLGAMYQTRKLWESMPADLAAADLRRRLDRALQNQRQNVLERASGRFPGLLAPWRWLLTIGAIIWFPLAQPIMEAMLQENTWALTRKTLLVVVQMLSVTHFLSCLTFLLIWFLSLWMMLRWMTQQRVQRIVSQIDMNDESSLPGQTAAWMDELLEPINEQKRRVDALVQKLQALRAQLP